MPGEATCSRSARSPICSRFHLGIDGRMHVHLVPSLLPPCRTCFSACACCTVGSSDWLQRWLGISLLGLIGGSRLSTCPIDAAMLVHCSVQCGLPSGAHMPDVPDSSLPCRACRRRGHVARSAPPRASRMLHFSGSGAGSAGHAHLRAWSTLPCRSAVVGHRRPTGLLEGLPPPPFTGFLSLCSFALGLPVLVPVLGRVLH